MLQTVATTVAIVGALALSSCHAHSHAIDQREPNVRNSPWAPLHNSRIRSDRPSRQGAGSVLDATARLWFGAYKNTISRIDGNTCRFSPSCSRFMLDAMQSAGAPGVLLGFGRLIRPHQYDGHYHTDSTGFLRDSVANYTFWWRTPVADDFSSYADPAHAWFQHIRLVK